jgi:hypothetical protein
MLFQLNQAKECGWFNCAGDTDELESKIKKADPRIRPAK